MSTQLFDLSGRVALVTGAASGLGRAIAAGMAGAGADIAIADIDDAGMLETAQQVEALGRRALAVHCDTGSPGDVEQLFEQLERAFGRIDILVNNAYSPSRYRPEDIPLAAWEHVLRVNLTGYHLCAQQAGRRMQSSGRGGSIINIASIAASSALGRGNYAYSVSKGAVLQLTRELAVEWAEYHIRVNAILPCQFRTPPVQAMLEDQRLDGGALLERLLAGIPLKRLGEPADIAGPAIFLASDAARMVTGALLPVDGGNLALNAGGSTSW